MSVGVYKYLILLAVLNLAVSEKPCNPRQYNHNSIVCVCDANYCDEISKIDVPQGEYAVYSSDLSGRRFEKTTSKILKENPQKSIQPKSFMDILRNLASYADGDVTLKINREKTYQSINGFGGSFTDATGYNLKDLSDATRKNFVNSYFSENGLEYNVGRVPIGGCDFSTHAYAYNMYPENDKELSNFSLTMEDYEFKIRLIKEAGEVATDEIRLFSAAWSPPIWMKTNNAYGGVSRLKEEYYQTWADYHRKFFDEYDKNDVQFWAVSTGNEPSNGIIPLMAFNSLGWMPNEQAKWVGNNLGPTLKNSKFSYLKIMALDDQRFSLPWWIEWISNNEEAWQYIDGIATHWYWDDLISTKPIETTHKLFPDRFLMSTEACVGDKPWQIEKVALGSWDRAEMYIYDILESLNHWYNGWIDWNLALNRQGGPNWFDNYVDSAVIVLPEQDEFLKQPLFYAMGHFSKFIPRESVRVDVESLKGRIDNVAFLRPDSKVSVVLYNPNNNERTVTLQEEGVGFIQIKIPPRSVHSLVY